MQPPHAAYAPAPPQPRRRWGLLIAGTVGALLALAMVVLGAVVAMGAASVSTFAPVGQARTPDVITFDAERARYELYALHERRGKSIGSAAHYDCTVTLANGREIEIDGSVQVVSSEVGATQSIGAFDAVPGETVIACDAGRRGELFIVDKESPWKNMADVATLAGALMLLLSAAAIVAGALWKKT